MRPPAALWWLIALALAACLLPWVVNPGAGLSLNPADLAEWTSLSPTVQAQSPTLLTTFLLRTPLLVVALLVGFATARFRGWAALGILLLATAQLPPFEFLADSGNANYRQQALMAGLTAGLGLLALFAVPRRLSLPGVFAVSAAGIIAAWLGMISALTEMRAFGLAAQPGDGIVVYSAALVGAFAVALQAGIKKRHPATPPSASEPAELR